MNAPPQSDRKTRRGVDRIANYAIQFLAIAAALQIGRMWIQYPWHWYVPISIGVYVAVLVVARVLYRTVERVWTYSSRN